MTLSAAAVAAIIFPAARSPVVGNRQTRTKKGKERHTRALGKKASEGGGGGGGDGGRRKKKGTIATGD